MPIILSSAASAPERPTPMARPARPMSWTGVDGSVWPLVGAPNLNPQMRRGVRGLHMPQMDVTKSSTPLVHGAEITGYHIPERATYWPLLFRASSVDEWERQHADFFHSFHPVRTGTWTVGAGEAARTLELRGDFRGDYSFERDPFVSMWAVIGVQLEAPRPLWRGKPKRRRFSNPTGVPFLPPGGGPPLHISTSATLASATIENVGDEPAYLVWTVIGPAEGISLGVGGALIDVPFNLSAGEVLVINTDPAEQFATRNGADCTRELGFQQFAPVAPNGTSPLTIEFAGAGEVEAAVVPLHWTAF